MTLEQIYYISQIVSVIAIFGSLVFVGLQMRAQTRESRLAAVELVSMEYHGMMSSVMENAEFRAAWIKMLRVGMDALTFEEAFILTVWIQQYLRTYETMFIQHRAGRLEDELWQSHLRHFASFMATSGFNLIWEQRSHFFTPGFRNLVNSLPKVDYLNAEALSHLNKHTGPATEPTP